MFSGPLITALRIKFFFCEMIILRLLSSQRIRAVSVQRTVVGLRFLPWVIRKVDAELWCDPQCVCSPCHVRYTVLLRLYVYVLTLLSFSILKKEKYPNILDLLSWGASWLFYGTRKSFQIVIELGGTALLISENLGRLDKLYLFKSGFFSAIYR